MGNANGREEGSENGGGGGDEVSEGSNHALSPTARAASADLMVSSPPHEPRQSRSPLLFSSQVRFLFFSRYVFVSVCGFSLCLCKCSWIGQREWCNFLSVCTATFSLVLLL